MTEPKKCGARNDCQNEATEPHSCPYAEEINDDFDEEHCECCDDCRQECVWDI